MRLNVLAVLSLVAALGAGAAPAEPCKRLLVWLYQAGE